MKNCLVTGGAGFIGSNLVDELVNRCEKVVVIDNQSSKSRDDYYFNDKAINFDFDLSDSANIESIKDILIENKIRYVFHMAADVSVQFCVENPQQSYSNNILSTLNMLEASRLSQRIDKFVFSSTSAIYGLTDKTSSESDPINCLNAYSYSKYAGEQLMKMYYDLYGMHTISFRYFNVYGNRQATTGQYAPVIGIFSKQKEETGVLTITGDGLQTRDFVHVSDVVNANILVAEKNINGHGGEVFNVGTGRPYTIRKLANMIHNKCEHIAPRFGEARFSSANINKIKSTFDWEPKVNLEEWLKPQ